MPIANAPPAAAQARNPVLKRMARLNVLWWEQTYHPHLRVIVLRAPAHSQRMIDAFFTLQQFDSEYATPDLFISFNQAFETGFSYSRELRSWLVGTYEYNKGQFVGQGITAPWSDAAQAGYDSPAGFMEAGLSLARHLGGQVISAVLRPNPVSSRESFERWLDAAMQVPITPDTPGVFRLVLLDDDDTRAWQPFVERHAAHATVVQAPVDMLEAAREVAAQSGGGGGAQVLYRQLYTDMYSLLQLGDAPAVERKAVEAMQLAARQGWNDQRAVIDMLVGGAWLNARDFPRSIERYRAARVSAQEVMKTDEQTGRMLIVQSWMSEAGAWMLSNDIPKGARAYEESAEAAKQIPHAFFAIEGYRSAAQCWYACGEHEKALEAAMLGIREARGMPDADRPNSTVPLLLNDLLRMHDLKRSERIANCTTDYEKRILQAQTDADRAAYRLGPHPESKAVKAIEERLLQAYEKAFQSWLADREKLVAGGSNLFQTVVALGRQWLHPTWSGLPDVRHPLDQEPQEWSNAPEFAVLPDPQAMLETA